MARALFTSAFKRYLSQLYHISKQYPFWNDVDTWPLGAIVWWTGGAYKALVENVNVEPGTDPATWELTPVRTQRWWRRVPHKKTARHQHQANYPYGVHNTTYDDYRSRAYGNHRMIFLQIARAWVSGSGYPAADPDNGTVTVDYAAWNAIAAAYLYQVRLNSYWRRTAFQWFMAYNLAAASVNGYELGFNSVSGVGDFAYSWEGYIQGPNWYRIVDNGNPMCFTGAPLPVYDPIKITACEYIDGNLGDDPSRHFLNPTPNLGEYGSDNPPTPSDIPFLLISTGPMTRGPFKGWGRTLARCVPNPFWAHQNTTATDVYDVFTPVVNLTPPYDYKSLLEIRYVRQSAPWLADGSPLPCDCPGPPFKVRAGTQVFSAI